MRRATPTAPRLRGLPARQRTTGCAKSSRPRRAPSQDGPVQSGAAPRGASRCTSSRTKTSSPVGTRRSTSNLHRSEYLIEISEVCGDSFRTPVCPSIEHLRGILPLNLDRSRTPGRHPGRLRSKPRSTAARPPRSPPTSPTPTAPRLRGPQPYRGRPSPRWILPSRIVKHMEQGHVESGRRCRADEHGRAARQLQSHPASMNSSRFVAPRLPRSRPSPRPTRATPRDLRRAGPSGPPASSYISAFW